MAPRKERRFKEDLVKMKITSTKLKRLIKEEIGEELDEGFLGGLVDKLRGRSVENTEKLHDEIKKLLGTKKPGSVEEFLKALVVYKKINAGGEERAIEHLGLNTLLDAEKEFGVFLDEKTGKLKPMATKNFETISANILEKYRKGITKYNEAYEKWYGDGFGKDANPAAAAADLEDHRAANTPERRAARIDQHNRDERDRDVERKAKASSDAVRSAYDAHTAKKNQPLPRSTNTSSPGGNYTGYTALNEAVKVTKTKLKRIIQEELAKILKEN
jgi:hypothetical protein